MKNITFKFYSVLKHEDAMPYVGNDILVAADGLGGSGSSVHAIDRVKHANMRSEIIASAFGDMTEISPELARYIEELIVPMVDGKDDTSALWASRIVIARCVYALTEGGFKNADLGDIDTRAMLAAFISEGLREVAKNFDLQKGKYDGQLLLPTTLAFVRYTETEHTVIAETLWAGDSRCYTLTLDGLKVLSVDDEDNSGSITNLFYADNEKVVLNYIRHEITKPCVLMTVSDGVFDPFDPHDHLGVEHTLLSAINECNSEEQLSEWLKKFYDEVHGDDSTMAFVAFGFNGYADLRERLAERISKIIAIRQKQADLYGALEVMNQTEEDASHYVLSRTNDRYDYIVSLIADAVESGVADIAVTPEVRKIVESVKKEALASVEKAKKQNREQALKSLYEYVKAHPELVASQILMSQPIDFKGVDKLESIFKDMKKYSAEYVAIISDRTVLTLEAELDAYCEELHRKIMERITFYRNAFDRLWGDKTSEYNLRRGISNILRTWQEVDLALQYYWNVGNIGVLPEDDRVLAREINDFIDKRKKIKTQIKARLASAETSHNMFVKCWNTLFNYIKNKINTIHVLLSPEIVHNFGLDISKEGLSIEPVKDIREEIMRQLKESKDVIVSDIVKVLAVNCNATSTIDSQYNATKLELFRTYYRLKTTDGGDLKAFEMQLAALEAEYTSLIEK